MAIKKAQKKEETNNETEQRVNGRSTIQIVRVTEGVMMMMHEASKTSNTTEEKESLREELGLLYDAIARKDEIREQAVYEAEDEEGGTGSGGGGTLGYGGSTLGYGGTGGGVGGPQGYGTGTYNAFGQWIPTSLQNQTNAIQTSGQLQQAIANWIMQLIGGLGGSVI